MDGSSQILVLASPKFLGNLQEDPGGGALLPWPDGHWYRGWAPGDGLEYDIKPGTLGGAGGGGAGGAFTHLAAEMFLDGIEGCTWRLILAQADSSENLTLTFGLLNQASARIRIPLEALLRKQNLPEREGAWLRPKIRGESLERVDLGKVQHIRLQIERCGSQPVRWCMTPLTLWQKSPAPLAQPLLPKGMLLDPLGQSTLRDWPGKTRSIDEVTTRLREQSSSAINHKWPGEFSRHGGHAGGGGGGGGGLEASGFFRTQHDGRRWWLVDPQGHLFWSVGLNGVNSDVVTPVQGLENTLAWRPPAEGTFRDAHHGRPGEAGHGINFLAVNFIRSFGPQTWREHWWKIAQSQLRMCGFNTVGNWSEWPRARVVGFPYVRALQMSFPTTPLGFRDFPDVFHPNFARDAAVMAEQLRETLGDAALLGYFLMNTPQWSTAGETPAAGMLYHAAADCQTRKALAEFLRRRHGTDAGLSAAWGVETTYISIAFNEFRARLNQTARADLEAFSAVMIEKLFKTLGEACRQVDPIHLNLGVRYPSLPPEWCLEGMKSFDVCAVNAYEARVPAAEFEALSQRLGRPMLVGAWQFGALDAGLPASGPQRVATQKARGQAYQAYLDSAAATVSCVGVHYSQMYDPSALGRFDGENYEIGFVDVCNRPYEELAWAARQSHERVYRVALGEVPPVEELPEYLPSLCY